jgi:hypothetical protein
MADGSMAEVRIAMKLLLLVAGVLFSLVATPVSAQTGVLVGSAATGQTALYDTVKQLLKERNIAALAVVCAGQEVQEVGDAQETVVQAALDLCKEQAQSLSTCIYLGDLDLLLAALRDLLPADQYALWYAARFGSVTPAAPTTFSNNLNSPAFSYILGGGGGGGGQEQTMSPTRLQ